MKKIILELELVPSSCFYKNVRQILTSTQWKIICNKVYNECYYKCIICEGVGEKHPVEAHETWEYDYENLVQKLKYIKGLCNMCHTVKHFGLAEIQGKRNLALNHLMKINNLNKVQAEKYISEQFIIWAKRSKYKWTLDISLLNDYGIDISKLGLK